MGEVISFEQALRQRAERAVRAAPVLAPGSRQSKGGTMDSLIARQIVRSADHREEERSHIVTAGGPLWVTVVDMRAEVLDLSAGGLRVAGSVVGRIGEQVSVRFEGRAPLNGRIVWIGKSETGLALNC